MRDTRASAGGMRSAIERSGYYPGVVSDAVYAALGQEPVVSYVVQHDALLDPGMEVRRHMTVLALTPTRLVYSHTDEHPAEDSDSRPRADRDGGNRAPCENPGQAGRAGGRVRSPCCGR